MKITNGASKNKPLLGPPLSQPAKQGSFCDAEITTPGGNMQQKSANLKAFFFTQNALTIDLWYIL